MLFILLNNIVPHVAVQLLINKCVVIVARPYYMSLEYCSLC